MGGAFVLALLSKEQAMTLPALATVYEHFYREDRSETNTPQKLARYGLLWLVAVVYVLCRVHFFGALAPNVKYARAHPIANSALRHRAGRPVRLEAPLASAALHLLYLPPEHEPVRSSRSRWAAGTARVGCALFGLLAQPRTKRPLRIFRHPVVLCHAGSRPQRSLGGRKRFHRTLPLFPFRRSGVARWSGRDEVVASRGAASRAATSPRARRLTVGGLFAARIVIRNRDWKNNIVLYTRTLDLSPGAGPIESMLVAAYWREGAVDKAEMVWREKLARRPNSVDAINNLGLVASRRHQYPEAVRFFQRAIKLKPDLIDPHLNLGETYLKMGLTGPAELQLREAVALSRFDIRAYNEVGKLFVWEGRIEEAEDQFRASLRIAPNALAYDYLGTLNIRRRAMEDAERDFQAALSLDESDSNAHFGLGYFYKAAGRKAEALSQYQAGLVEDPTNAQALAAVQQFGTAAPALPRNPRHNGYQLASVPARPSPLAIPLRHRPQPTDLMPLAASWS